MNKCMNVIRANGQDAQTVNATDKDVAHACRLQLWHSGCERLLRLCGSTILNIQALLQGHETMIRATKIAVHGGRRLRSRKVDKPLHALEGHHIRTTSNLHRKRQYEHPSIVGHAMLWMSFERNQEVSIRDPFPPPICQGSKGS